MGEQLTELRAALEALGALNRAEVWSGVECELDELRRRELGTVLADVEPALGTVAELLGYAAEATREYAGAPADELDEAAGAVWSAQFAVAGVVDELGGAVSPLMDRTP